MWMVRWSGVLVAIVGLLGCQPSPESYFPLEAGAQWRYVTSGELNFFAGYRYREEDGGIHRATASQPIDDIMVDVKAQEARSIGGRDATPMVTVNQLENGHSYAFFARDKRGIAEIARQARGSNDVVPLAEPVYQLRFPLSVGTTWDTRQPMRVTDSEELMMTGTAQIAAVDAEVTVPAGTFRRCVRIDSESIGHRTIPHLNGRDIDGDAEIQVNTSTWLAPGVGTVKHTLRMTLRPESLGSGEQTLELVQFKTR
ncbi:MAG: hypothetical protein SF182_09300 [Deltaproteobacteria bacterium]|nr:hypothetical protein [Deltaproteobacteria bacterium]